MREEEQHPLDYLLYVKYMNEEDYFEAHEVLEGYWHGDRIDFYKGLIQLAVGLYHLGSGNVGGFHALFKRAIELLQPYRPEYRAMDVERIVRYMEECRSQVPQVALMEREDVEKLGVERIRLSLTDGTPIPTVDPRPKEEEDDEE
ncbi:MAG TPA: DUF309 domain-containing protein [Bacilli bacterium]|nr:DUF309 domain-containing protein [Bacilli bacterium]